MYSLLIDAWLSAANNRGQARQRYPVAVNKNRNKKPIPVLLFFS